MSFKAFCRREVSALGIFGRRRQPQISVEDQAQATALLKNWERAQSSSDWRSAAQALAALGDWEWWLQLTRKGRAESNYLLVGQVACFVTQVKAMGFIAGSGFGTLSANTHREFDQIAVDALSHAPEDLVVQDGSAGRLDAGTVRNWAAGRIENGMH